MMIVGSLPMGLRLSLVLALVLFLFNTSAGDTQPSGDCSRIFIGSLNEANAVHIPSTGIYHSLDGARHNDRPVYQHASGQMYLYFLFSKLSGHGFWVVGPEVGKEEAVMAASAGDSYTPEVTQQQWWLWNSEKGLWSAVNRMKAVCVDEEFGPCTSGRLLMTGISSRYGLQKKLMGLYLLTNRTHSLRPVYKHEGLDYFLFYTNDVGGKWIVGPEVGKMSGGMFAYDFALRPEFVMQTWVVFAGRYFENDSGIKLRCQGIEIRGNTSTGTEREEGKEGNESKAEEVPQVVGVNEGQIPPEVEIDRIETRLEDTSPFQNHQNVRVKVRDRSEVSDCDSTCLHGGHCQRSNPNVYRCICPDHYFGLRCQIVVDCGHPPLVNGQQIVSTTGHYFLDVTFYRCPENTILDGSSGVACQLDGTWTDPPKCLTDHHHITPIHVDGDIPAFDFML